MSWRINNTHKYGNFSNNDARNVKSGSFDGGEDDEHNGVGLVEISSILAAQDEFFFETTPFDIV